MQQTWRSLVVLTLLVLIGSVGVLNAAVTNVERVSVSSAGVQGNDDSGGPAISADGRFVAFHSSATTLVTNDSNGEGGVFLRDLQADATLRVSLGQNGAEGNGGSDSPSISADGRFVAIRSEATNLVDGDTNGREDIFVRDRELNTTERVNVSSSGVQAEFASERPSISADGRFVAFLSRATTLVPGDNSGRTHAYLHDRSTHTTQRVTVSSAGTIANDHCFSAIVSPDGRLVGFSTTAANLVADDTNGHSDVFVRDHVAGTTVRVSVSPSGDQANDGSGMHGLSADGRYLVFTSGASNLVPGGVGSAGGVFVRDLILRTNELVSLTADGSHPNNGVFSPSISGNGRFVAFASTSSNMVPGDPAVDTDLYVFDRDTDTIEWVTQNFVAPRTGFSQTSAHSALNADGRYLAFSSHLRNLVAADTNEARDVFVAELSTTPPPSPPAAPTNPIATAVSSTQINLTWDHNSTGETGFEIERDGAILASVGENVTSHSDTGLPPGTRHAYRVRATSAAGPSEWSNVAEATTLPPLPAGMNLYRANLHSHTGFCDGRTLNRHPSTKSPLTAYRAAKTNNLQVMAVTDHGEQLTRAEWQASLLHAGTETSSSFVGLRGFEWTHTYRLIRGDRIQWLPDPFADGKGHGHINIIGSANRVGAYKRKEIGAGDVKSSLYTFCQWLAEPTTTALDGGTAVAQFNHPSAYDNSDHFADMWLPGGSYGARLRESCVLMEMGAHLFAADTDLERCEGGVLFNDQLANPEVSSEYWFRKALVNGWQVASTNNEDNHRDAYGMGDGQHTGIYSPALTPPATLGSLRSRRVFSSEDWNSRVLLMAHLESEPSWHWMGESFTGSPGTLTLHLTAGGLDPIQRVEIVAPLAESPYGQTLSPAGSPLPELTFTGRLQLSRDELLALPTNSRGETYLYAKVVQEDDDLLYSAPIWFKPAESVAAARTRDSGSGSGGSDGWMLLLSLIGVPCVRLARTNRRRSGRA